MEVLTERMVGSTRIAAVQGDITALEVEAVVNAANEMLAHGGGVAAAIARAGAPAVQAESDEWIRTHGPVRPGSAAVTSAGSMPADMVIHVVGPRYRADQDNPALLRAAVEAALTAAVDHGASSVAFPAISAGIFGYPPDEATAVLTATVETWAAGRGEPNEVLLVGFDAAMARRFAVALAVD